MKISLDKLRYQGEDCFDKNRDKPISNAQFRTIALIEKHLDGVFGGNTFGEAWDFIKS